VNLLPDAVVRLDSDRRICEVNAAAVALLGRAASELIGAKCSDAVRPRSLDGSPLLTEGWHGSSAIPGVTRLPEHEITVATAAGDVRVRVTGRYERDASRRLAGATLVLRRSSRPGSGPTGAEVVSTVSHELRSPLTSVKGYTSLLLSRWERIGDEQKKLMLEQVHADADRVTRLIGELLDISRLETGRLVLRRQMVDLRRLVDSVLANVSLACPDLECSVSFAEEFPTVYADPDKLEQVLTNLVENAAKYASPTGMKVYGNLEGTAITVAVSDRGEGIPSADLPRVFRKFFRRDHGKPSGTGLGLWISRGLVEAHGGRLTAASTIGEGSTFAFTLPLVSIESLLEDAN